MVLRTIFLFAIVLVTGCATTTPELSHDRAQPVAAPEKTEVSSKNFDLRKPANPINEHADTPQYEDVWQRIRDGFALPPLTNPYLDNHVNWYGSRPEYIARVVERARPFLFYIVEEIDKRGMPMELALLPVVESAFQPTAYSRAHAAGLWQFIPGTAKHYQIKMNWWYDGRRDVLVSTRAALDYLEFLHDEFDGNWFYAIAAYNAGERGLQRAINRNKSSGKSTHYSHLRLKKETKHYVPKLVALKQVIGDPERFGIDLPSIPNEPYFEVVGTQGQIDLNVALELTSLSRADFKHLNAGFKRWATDPDGPHRLLVPVSQAKMVAENISALPASKRLEWAYYKIQQGDTLGHIASRYGVSVRSIQLSNDMNSTFIRAGKDLLIPLSPDSLSQISAIEATGSDGSVVHRVSSGDTLWGIARRYNVYVAQLAQWNSIRAGDLLHLGQNIVVYLN